MKLWKSAPYGNLERDKTARSRSWLFNVIILLLLEEL